VHLVGFTIEIYHDARSHERQICGLIFYSYYEIAQTIVPCFSQLEGKYPISQY